MKKLSKKLSKEVFRTLYKDPNFKDVYQLVCNRAVAKPYLVGGKLFRTLIEIIYNYPAMSNSCDFDFASIDIIKGKYWGKKFYKEYINFNGRNVKEEIPNPYQGNSVRLRTLNGCKIDLISISDLGEIRDGKLPVSIEGYLANVPLSIQSIAMDLEKHEIFGKVGIDSINEKYVWINNKNALKGYAEHKRINPDEYLMRKAESIKFGHDSKIKIKKKDNSYRKNIVWDVGGGGGLYQYMTQATAILPTDDAVTAHGAGNIVWQTEEIQTTWATDWIVTNTTDATDTAGL